MNKILFLLILLNTSVISLNAQKIYSTDHINQADLKVFVVEHENLADLKVYKVKHNICSILPGLKGSSPIKRNPPLPKVLRP